MRTDLIPPAQFRLNSDAPDGAPAPEVTVSAASFGTVHVKITIRQTCTAEWIEIYDSSPQPVLIDAAFLRPGGGPVVLREGDSVEADFGEESASHILHAFSQALFGVPGS